MSILKRLLVASNDVTKIGLAHHHEVHWFSTPVEPKEEIGRHGSVDSDAEEIYKIKEGHDDHGHGHHGPFHNEDIPEDEPWLKRPHEPASIGLFYDLFFVANLCTFTHVHEINDSSGMFLERFWPLIRLY